LKLVSYADLMFDYCQSLLVGQLLMMALIIIINGEFLLLLKKIQVK